VTNAKGIYRNAQTLFWHLKINEQITLESERVLWGVKVRISALRLKTMELLILASQVELKEPIELYAKRWKIETLFQSLKGRGFNFEDTHITKTRRLKRMVAVLAL
jgi:transposase